jgi:hypothetical protein
MPTLVFEGETHGEIVTKVRRWLASIEGQEEGKLTAVEAVEQGAELTKEALRVIAAAAPAPIAHSEVMKALTAAGYKATDAAKRTVIESLDSIEELSGGDVLRRVRDARRSAVYEMNAAVARQVMRALRG